MQVTTRPPESIDAAQVWEDFHQSLLAFIARRVRDRDTAEDILQEVMLRIHRHAGELEHASAIGAWVHQIARNAITDHYRRAAQRREHPAGIDVRDDEAFEPEHVPDTARSEIAACLRPLRNRKSSAAGPNSATCSSHAARSISIAALGSRATNRAAALADARTPLRLLRPAAAAES